MTKETSWSNLLETIAVLGVSERSLRRYSAAGKIKTIKIGRSTWYDVESYQAGALEEATEADTLVKTSFLAIIYDSTKNRINFFAGKPIRRPLVGFMILEKQAQQLYDGTFGKVYKNIAICCGTNLDIRMPSNGGLIESADWNQIAIQTSTIKMIEAGELKTFLPESEQWGASYRAYSQNDALELVGNTYGITDLNRYSVGEDRRLILAAIEDRRDHINQVLKRNQTIGISDQDPARNYRGVA